MQNTMTAPKGNMTETMENRSRGIPAWMVIQINVNGKSSGMFCEVDIIDFYRKGVCIEWEYCFSCSSFTEGCIHPECIFSPYNACDPESHELSLHIDVPGCPEGFSFKGKAVCTFRMSELFPRQIKNWDFHGTDLYAAVTAFFCTVNYISL